MTCKEFEQRYPEVVEAPEHPVSKAALRHEQPLDWSDSQGYGINSDDESYRL